MATKKHIVLLLVFLLLLISKISYSQNQNYDVEFITTKDGLANGCIQQIMQDSKGFMWFATEGGLNRYDGYNIKLYDCGQKFVRTIFEDPADSGKILWIGTQGGLFKFDRDNETFLLFKHYPTDSTSISDNDIECIYKDKNGIYWIGTGGGGLNKFNPHTGKFISYRNNPNDPTSISSNTVFTICEDYVGNLWVGTFLGGLERFDRKANKFIHYKYDPNNPHTIYSNHIFSLFEDSYKTLWIGTSGTLFRYDRTNDKFIQHTLQKDGQKIFIDGLIHSIYEDKEKTLWVVCNADESFGGVYGINSNRTNFILISNELNSADPSSVYIDHSGIIWIGTFCNGISKIIPRKKFFNHYNTFSSGSKIQKFSWIYSFFEDEFNNLWVGTNEGLKKIENGKINSYPILMDGTDLPVLWISKSKFDKWWLAYHGGIIEADPQTKKNIIYTGKYITYPSTLIDFLEDLIKDSLEIASIKRVANNQAITEEFVLEKTTNMLVYSTGEGDLEELSDFGWITSENSRDVVWKMESDKSRYIEGAERESIVGGPFKNREQIAVLTLKPGKYELHYRTNEKHAYGDWIRGAPPRPDLWGISIFAIESTDYTKYRSEVEKKAYHKIHWGDILGLVEDNEGRIWALLQTEYNSVHTFDKVQHEFVPTKLKLNGKELPSISRIIKDSAGNLWFRSYDNRLIRKDINDNCEVNFNLSDLLENNTKELNYNAITHYYQDSKGNMWIGSDIGLFRYNLATEKIDQFNFSEFLSPNTIEGIVEDNSGKLWISTSSNLIKFDAETKLIRKYESSDGLPDMKFAGTSCYKLKNGSLAFGGSDGFIMFDPDSINDNNTIPQITITSFQIFNKPVIIGELSPLDKAINESGKVILNYNQDVFTFEFASLEFTDPTNNKYSYKMEGVDPDWVHTDANRRFATYTKLSPGEYVFKVKGSNNDGVWNEAGTSILIIISPPWWKTWWAYALYSILILSIIYFTWKMQVKRIRMGHEYQMSRFEAEKLHEVDGIKSRFFTNISHEFRTPLTLILGPAQKIVNKESTDTVRDAGIIKRNANRLLQLVNQLLDLSKLESGKLKLEVSKGNIVSFIKGTALSFESLIESKDITLKIIPEKEYIELYFDKEKMTKILSNILSNAFKFTPERGKVFVTITETPDNTVEIKIRNTGIGIAKDELPKLFDRFYQVDSSLTKEHEGTGIGLALTKELVELHHGSIRVDSEVGKWTEFMINLSLGRDHLKEYEIMKADETLDQIEAPVEEEYLTSRESTDTETTKDEGRTTILVVEDNYDMREYVKESLCDNYRVEEAVNGEQGVRIAEDVIPDLIISDLMMPKMDGNELTRILKNDERTSHIPIILLTAKSGQENKIEGLQTGADDYLTKPFDLKELKVRVDNLISIRKKLQEKFSKGEFLFKRSDKKIKSIDEKFLSRVLEVIEKHLSEEDFSIEECSSEVGLSRTHFHKKLRALVGKSPSQYLRTVRLHRAKQMIEEERGNVSEVAYSVGFSSPAYFSKCFKEEFGYPPSKVLG